MRKLILSIILVLLFVVNVFAFSWYYYIDKKVEVCTVSKCYIGKVEDVWQIEICKKDDPLTHQCIDYEHYYIMVLKLNNDMIGLLSCEEIKTIKELND